MKTTMFLLTMLLSLAAVAGADVRYSTPGVAGYDLVSYHDTEKPLRGNGNHVAVHDGVTYVFVNDENRKKFERDPQKYVPAYGGYCAYGVSVGKKFVGDPDVWEVVDGRLYLNLDNKIKSIWIEDIPGNLKKANDRWPNIRAKAASDL